MNILHIPIGEGDHDQSAKRQKIPGEDTEPVNKVPERLVLKQPTLFGRIEIALKGNIGVCIPENHGGNAQEQDDNGKVFKRAGFNKFHQG